MNYIETQQAFDSVIKAMSQHKGLFESEISRLESNKTKHLFAAEVAEKSGIVFPAYKVHYNDCVHLNDYMVINYFGPNRGQISWPDNGEQPNGEYLLKLYFPTGAYIFGDDYPKELFKQFFNELKSYSPDYLDSNNSSLYFKLENAKKIFDNFYAILQKYHKINKKDAKERQIAKLRAELESLN